MGKYDYSSKEFIDSLRAKKGTKEYALFCSSTEGYILSVNQNVKKDTPVKELPWNTLRYIDFIHLPISELRESMNQVTTDTPISNIREMIGCKHQVKGRMKESIEDGGLFSQPLPIPATSPVKTRKFRSKVIKKLMTDQTFVSLLGKITDTAISERYGITRDSVNSIRKELGISKWQGGGREFLNNIGVPVPATMNTINTVEKPIPSTMSPSAEKHIVKHIPATKPSSQTTTYSNGKAELHIEESSNGVYSYKGRNKNGEPISGTAVSKEDIEFLKKNFLSIS